MKKPIQKSQKVIHHIQQAIVHAKSFGAAEVQTDPELQQVYHSFCELLHNGSIRAAEKKEGNWIVNTWVKEGILLGFKLGQTRIISHAQETLQFTDKDTLPLQNIAMLIQKGVRVVPGGSSIRIGTYMGNKVIMMPPSYVNIGAYIDDETMIDSHVLIGSCAQIGKRCHISAGVQIGGVLEPITAHPCIVEDDVLMGVHSAITEGVIVQSRAVIAAGVIITSSTPVYDVVRETIYKHQNGSLIIPAGAVVVPGNRQIRNSSFAQKYGLHIATPIIRKYRDAKTDAKTVLEMIARE